MKEMKKINIVFTVIYYSFSSSSSQHIALVTADVNLFGSRLATLFTSSYLVLHVPLFVFFISDILCLFPLIFPLELSWRTGS